MEYVINFIIGIVGGLIGGMGMGGGTLLIPLLGIFSSVGQHGAQAINLIAFIPMAIVALCVHIKNNYVKFSNVLLIIISGVVACIVGCYVAKIMSGDLLKKCFGGFLFLLSIYQFITQVKEKNS